MIRARYLSLGEIKIETISWDNALWLTAKIKPEVDNALTRTLLGVKHAQRIYPN